MTEVILYPTETLYALGVNALDIKAQESLRALKGRGTDKAASWLVRNMEDVRRYAEVDGIAERIAGRFLPGPLTLVLKAKTDISRKLCAADGTIGFRVSRDPAATELIETYMHEHNAPLTATSANVSGAPCLPTPGEILQQFGAKADEITRIVDDGARKSLASTIVRVVGGTVSVIREGAIGESEVVRAAKE